MADYWKIISAILLAVIFCLVIGKTEKDFSLMLTMLVCCIACVAAVSYLAPSLDFLIELASVGNFQNGIIAILLKAIGISFVGELAGMVCADAGNSSLEKTVHFLSTAVIVYLSLPMFQSVLTLIRDVLGEI